MSDAVATNSADRPIETHAARKLAEAWREVNELKALGDRVNLDSAEGKRTARAQAIAFRKVAKWIDRLVDEVEIAERNAKRAGLR